MDSVGWWWWGGGGYCGSCTEYALLFFFKSSLIQAEEENIEQGRRIVPDRLKLKLKKIFKFNFKYESRLGETSLAKLH